MVIINLKGGLGNQLFEYASALAIATARNQKLAFDVQSFMSDSYGRQYAFEPFKINYRLYAQEDINSFLKLTLQERILNYLKPRESKRYYSLRDQEFDPSILNATVKNQYLNGYFANPSYFEDIRPELLQQVSLKENLQTNAFKNKVKWIKQNKFISVHIRRADYISDKGANQLFETLRRDYYDRCIAHFEADASCSKKFLFFSDDIEWVKSEFQDLDHCYFIEEPELYKDYYDLMLMASCEHNIIANSTFSWWGAWLNTNPEKTVLAPQKWYRNEHYQKNYQTFTFIPKTWLLK